MSELREPKLGVAVGRKGCGKTFTTNRLVSKYIMGNPQMGVPGRRVLVLDVNDEYEHIKALKISDVMRFSVHPIIEARRIRPFHHDGKKFTINDIQDALFKILDTYRGGLLLIEDPNRYLSDNLPNDLIGAICTNRHVDCDIIMHFQSIGRISPKIWQNLNWIRFHKNTDSVDRHKNKFEDKYEMLKLVEMYVEHEYHAGNERIYLHVDIDDDKIIGVDSKKFDVILDEYFTLNYKKIITPLLQQKDLGKGVKKYTPAEAVKFKKEEIIKYYLPKQK